MPLPDLLTLPQATAALAAAGLTLTDDQVTYLPTAIGAVSRAIRRFCGDRDFSPADYSEQHEPDADGYVTLAQFPVISCQALGGPRTALTIRAASGPPGRVAALLGPPGAAQGAIATLTLRSVGEAHELAIAAGATVDQIAASVATIPGWSATVADGYGGWPAGELVQTRHCGPGELAVYTEELPVDLDRGAGYFRVPRKSRRDWVWVRYRAGFGPIPGDVLQAAAEALADTIRSMARDQRLASEGIGGYSYSLANAADELQLPKRVWGLLSPYRVVRL